MSDTPTQFPLTKSQVALVEAIVEYRAQQVAAVEAECARRFRAILEDHNLPADAQAKVVKRDDGAVVLELVPPEG